ncbi:hypothetical protein ACOMHN_062515 [Nucella lapillus]
MPVTPEEDLHLHEESMEQDEDLHNGNDAGKAAGADDSLDTALPLSVRLGLASELLGHEATVSFKEFYAVANLQTLGMSMSVVSLTGLISGPITILLMPLLGWFSDAGTNPVRRRACVLILTTVILIFGIVSVILANNLPLSSCNQSRNVSVVNISEQTSSSRMEKSIINVNSSGGRVCSNNMSCSVSDFPSPETLMMTALPATTTTSSNQKLRTAPVNEFYPRKGNATLESLQSSPLAEMPSETAQPAKRSSELAPTPEKMASSTEKMSSSTPQRSSEMESTTENPSEESTDPCSMAAAVLAMFGYIVMEVGFQTVAANIRTWMLMCSPPSAPTPTLVTGLVMTSLGGMLTSGLNMVDMASALGLSAQSGLAVQITIQGVVILIPLVIGLILSLLTGLRQLKLLHPDQEHQYHQQQQQHHQQNQHQHHQHQPSAVLTSQENSMSVDVRANSNNFQNHTESGENHSDPNLAGIPYSPSNSISHTESARKFLPELSQSDLEQKHFGGNLSDKSKDLPSESSKTPINYGALDKESSLSLSKTSSFDGNRAEHDSSQKKLYRTEYNQTVCPCRRTWGVKVAMAILVCSAYFNFGSIIIYKLTISDFVGKAIYGGDPTAPTGSEELEK